MSRTVYTTVLSFSRSFREQCRHFKIQQLTNTSTADGKHTSQGSTSCQTCTPLCSTHVRFATLPSLSAVPRNKKFPAERLQLRIKLYFNAIIKDKVMYSEQECRELLPQVNLLVHIHTDMRVYEAKLACQVQMFVGLHSSVCSVEVKLHSVFKGLRTAV